jgi:pyruvate dehydrogenase E2 component (dihydrolipoamide acetyltransferase)
MIYEIKVPEAGFSITEATVIEWKKKVGDPVIEGETIVLIETDKVSVEIPAPGSGILREIHCAAGEVAPVGEVIGIIASEGEQPGDAEPLAEGITAREEAEPLEASASVRAPAEETGGVAPPPKVKASPLARAVAKKEGIDLSKVVGTGRGGRITKDDVIAFKAQKESVAGPPAEAEEKVLFIGWRKVVAERMTASVRNAPHYCQTIDIDVSSISDLIKRARDSGDKRRLTYLPFVIKAIQAGLKISPEVNAWCYEDGFVVQKNINAGVAVDIEGKLLVPVVRNVQDKSILEIAEEIEQLAGRARTEKLSPAELQGGTITLTNVGVFGIHSGMAIILPPQVTILAVGTVREEPSVVDGVVKIRKKMRISASFDHRVVNGGPAGRFLKEMKRVLEDMDSLVLSLR